MRSSGVFQKVRAQIGVSKMHVDKRVVFACTGEPILLENLMSRSVARLRCVYCAGCGKTMSFIVMMRISVELC